VLGSLFAPKFCDPRCPVQRGDLIRKGSTGAW